MNGNSLIEYIVSEGERRHENILKEAAEKADDLKKGLENRIDQMRRDARNSVDKEMTEYRVEVLNRAHSRRREMTANAKGEILDELFRQTEEAIAGIISGPSYPKVLLGLMKEALRAFSGRVYVYANSRDCSIIHDLIKHNSDEILTGLSCEIVSVINEDRISGGVELCAEDNTMSIINTLWSRLERKREEVLPEIRDLLFAPGNRERE